MDSNTIHCRDCNERYNSANHEPLFLDCCHTSCRSCVSKGKSSGDFRCSKCGTLVITPITQLSVNKDLIPSTTEDGAHCSRYTPPDCRNMGLLPHLEDWHIESEAQSAIALVSARAGRRPKNVTIHSWPSDPLKNLPQLLNTIAEACTGDIELHLMDSFWSTKLENDDQLSAAIVKHGKKLNSFCGSAKDALAVCVVRGESSCFGVRVACIREVTSFAAAPVKPFHVSCIGTLPASGGDHMRKEGWTPKLWSLPRLSSSKLDWALNILRPFLTVPCRELSLLLPGCRLTQENIRTLINQCAGSVSSIECESKSISQQDRIELQLFSQNKKINLQWKKF